MRIYLIRHGRQESPLCNVNVSLSPEGREQARLLGKRLLEENIGEIWSSDLLRAMETAVTPRTRCLDLGSGSGILSIAALRLGAASATGVDIDPKAEDAARENAAYNGFGPPEFTALTGNVTQDKALMAALAPEGYQLVLVNIVADVIVALAPALPALLSQDGALICSGILDTRLGDVTAALERAGLTLTSVTAEEDWRCVTARKSSPTLGKE